jgi:mono/diheme cytochrome c family protein
MRQRPAVALLLACAAVACGDGEPHAGGAYAAVAAPAAPTPAHLLAGEELYRRHCAECHGERGVGTDVGPPFLHRVYEPAHHADAAFHIAVMRGVVPHHWRFGPMPALPHVQPGEVDLIVAYVRWLQREAGIR